MSSVVFDSYNDGHEQIWRSCQQKTEQFENWENWQNKKIISSSSKLVRFSYL